MVMMPQYAPQWFYIAGLGQAPSGLQAPPGVPATGTLQGVPISFFSNRRTPAMDPSYNPYDPYNIYRDYTFNFPGFFQSNVPGRSSFFDPYYPTPPGALQLSGYEYPRNPMTTFTGVTGAFW